jgi:hypothetical protein
VWWVTRFSDRRNIVVIADEAHRSQYDFIDGFAKPMRDALPKASFIGFTGTPIESGDKNTQAVFGDLASQARHQLVSQVYHSRCRAPWSLTFTTSCNRRKGNADRFGTCRVARRGMGGTSGLKSYYSRRRR